MRRSTQIRILTTLAVAFAVAIVSALVYALPLQGAGPVWSWPLFGPGILASYEFAGREGWPSLGAMAVVCGLVNGAVWATIVNLAWRGRPQVEATAAIHRFPVDPSTPHTPHLAA